MKRKSIDTFAFATLIGASLVGCFRLAGGLMMPAWSEPSLHMQDVLVDRRWESVPWTGDNQPFQTARLSIDRRFRVTASTITIVSYFQQIAKNNPESALDQFQWAYAVWKQDQIPHPQSRDCSDVIVALADAPQPNTYDYARIRLLYQVVGPKERLLIERLLAQVSSDLPINMCYAFVLSTSSSKADGNRALSIAEGIASGGKYSPDVYLYMANDYYDVGFEQKEPALYRKAIGYYKQFLAMSSPDDWRRASAVHSIAYEESVLTNGGR